MTPSVPKRARDEALDWVKGFLVVLMVVYHSLNYSPYRGVAFAYLGFLPPSFIFLAGFLLTSSYLARYDVNDWRLHRRLLIRGAKLILLFTALNLALYLVSLGPMALSAFASNFQETYFTPGKRVAAFPILSSIGYLLLFAPLLLRMASWKRPVLTSLAFALLTLCSLMEWKGSLPYHVGMVSAGVIGTAFGLLPLERVSAFARQLVVGVALYCAYRTCEYFIGEPYAVQLTGVVTGLLVLYGLGLRLPTNNQIYAQVVLMGRYSLLGYIVQLGTLQVLVRIFGPFATPLAVSILAVATLLSTWTITVVLDRLRAKARIFDLTYRAAFA